MHTNERFEQLQSLFNSLKKSLDIEGLTQRIEQLETELSDPEIWQDNSKATKLTTELSQFKQKLNRFETVQMNMDNLAAALELGEEIEAETDFKLVEEDLQAIKKQEFLQGKFDQKGCLFTLHAGAGGVDAQDWAGMLCSMYQAFCKKQGWDCEIVHLQSGEEGGVKSVLLKIEGENSYGLLKEEAGVHRLVRISPFNSGNTRETSFALVEILPAGLEQEMDLQIDEKDLKWDYFMASGKGGQSVNTTYSAVRVVHLPTNLSVSCQNQRSQLQNKSEALKYLKNKLVALELKKHKDYLEDLKGGFTSAEWGSQIRSYVLHPYKMIKDHRSGWQTEDVLSVIEQGEILDVIWSVKENKAAG